MLELGSKNFRLLNVFRIIALILGSIPEYSLHSTGIVFKMTKSTGFQCTEKKHYYHNETMSCYMEKSQGPCKAPMVFWKHEDGVTGYCDCPDSGYLPWVYHDQTETCYQAYTQGFCENDQWLIFNPDYNVNCVPNPCLDEHQKLTSEEQLETPVVLFKNECVKLNELSELCPNPKFDRVRIERFNVFPECVSDKDLTHYSLTQIGKLKCQPGTRRDRRGVCRPRRGLNFSSAAG